MLASEGRAVAAMPGAGDRPAGAAPDTGSDAFRRAMRHVPGAVAIVAAGDGEGRRGFTATAWCSLSVEPPTLLVCASRSGSAHDTIAALGRFSVNQLALGQRDVAATFSGSGGIAGADRFAAASWSALATGAPVLDGAVANYDCELVGHHSYATHTIFMGRVVATRLDETREPLVYLLGGFGEVCGAAAG